MIPSQEVAERRVCMQARGDEETELEFDEDIVTGSDTQHFQRQVNAQTLKTPPKSSATSVRSAFYRCNHKCFSL